MSNEDEIVDAFPNQTVSEIENGNPSSGGPRLVDKDDPRSRLHFVKYLKRDGKTLKIWECGICEFRKNRNHDETSREDYKVTFWSTVGEQARKSFVTSTR